MRISAKAEYACLAMLELAASYRSPHPSRIKAIADAHSMPQRFLVQILLNLKTAGLVASVRGAAGGYQLTRAPENITLGQVINAIDEPPSRTDYALAKLGVPTAASETLLRVWNEVQAEERRLLDGLTLAELLRRSARSDALLYQI
jgi:Rrf2 family transcriptional regulator, cysteine metabolism repressor